MGFPKGFFKFGLAVEVISRRKRREKEYRNGKSQLFQKKNNLRNFRPRVGIEPVILRSEDRRALPTELTRLARFMSNCVPCNPCFILFYLPSINSYLVNASTVSLITVDWRFPNCGPAPPRWATSRLYKLR